MFNFFRMYNREARHKVLVPVQTVNADTTKETKMKAVITPTEDNRHAIVSGGQTVATYARKRDAVRGATRRGYTVLTV